MLLDHHITYTYSRDHEISRTRGAPYRRNTAAIKPPFRSECIRIRWTVRGVDTWSNRRCFAADDITKGTGRKVRRPSSKIQVNSHFPCRHFSLLDARNPGPCNRPPPSAMYLLHSYVTRLTFLPSLSLSRFLGRHTWRESHNYYHTYHLV